MTAEAVSDPIAPPTPTGSTAIRFVPGAIAVVVALAWVVVLIVTGSPPVDVLQWVLAVLVGVLAPGFVVLRVCRAAPAPLIEDLAWGAATGCLVAMLGWFLDRTLPWAPGPYVLGLAIIAAGLAVPAARQRVLARPAPGWGVGPALTIGASVVASLAWMTAAGLRAMPLTPAPHGTAYSQDLIYQLSLVGELRRTVSPTYAPVAGSELNYHWFDYAVTAHLLEHTGVDPFDSILRLGPATLIPAMLVLAAVVARRMSGLLWAGPIAAALLGAVGISEASRWSELDGTSGIFQLYWVLSPTQTLGWLAGLAAAGTVFAFVRRAPGDSAVPVALLVPFLVLCSGAKSSELPVLIAGIVLATLVAAIRRDWLVVRRCAVALGLALVVFEAANIVIYGGNSNGLRLQLWGEAYRRVGTMFPAFATPTSDLALSTPSVPGAVIATAIVLFLLPQLPRLLGLIFQLRYRAGDPTGWICTGTALAGLVLPFAFQHPGNSQIFLLVSAYPLGVVGAASGLALAGGRVRELVTRPVVRRRVGLALGAFVVAGALAAMVVAHAQPHFNPVQRWALSHPGDPKATGVSLGRMVWLWLTPTVTLLIVLVALTAVAALGLWRARAAGAHRRPPLVGLAALVLLLGTGVYGLTLQFGGTDVPAAGSLASVEKASERTVGGPLPTLRADVSAGRYVDQHAGANDVIATNMYCRSGLRPHSRPLPGCDARDFSASAFAQRRTLVGGWVYTDRITSEAKTLTVSYRNAPFWDPHLLNQEATACDHPTAQLLDLLYTEHGVRWIFVDRRFGPVASRALDRLAERRYRSAKVEVWHLRAPA